MAALALHDVFARVAKDGPVTAIAPARPAVNIAKPGFFSIETIGVDSPTPTAAVDDLIVIITPTPTPGVPVQQHQPEEEEEEDGAPSPHNADAGKGGGPKGDENTGECRLLGSFAIFVQLGLGALALLSLVYKRWRERPQRPVKVWFFDVSKQVVGSVLVHVANVFMSLLTSGKVSIKVDPGVVAAGRMLLRRGGDDGAYVPNPCSFYLLNLAIDVSIPFTPRKLAGGK
jgi:hypothetical protein